MWVWDPEGFYGRPWQCFLRGDWSHTRELLKTGMRAGCLFAAHKIRCLCLRLWNFLLVSPKEGKSHSWFHNHAADGVTLNVRWKAHTMRIKIRQQFCMVLRTRIISSQMLLSSSRALRGWWGQGSGVWWSNPSFCCCLSTSGTIQTLLELF